MAVKPVVAYGAIMRWSRTDLAVKNNFAVYRGAMYSITVAVYEPMMDLKNDRNQNGS